MLDLAILLTAVALTALTVSLRSFSRAVATQRNDPDQSR